MIFLKSLNEIIFVSIKEGNAYELFKSMELHTESLRNLLIKKENL